MSKIFQFFVKAPLVQTTNPIKIVQLNTFGMVTDYDRRSKDFGRINNNDPNLSYFLASNCITIQQ